MRYKMRWLAFVLAPITAGCAHGTAQPVPEARVLVQYRAAVIADDAALLRRLAEASGAQVEFAASVAPDAAAYRLRCPPADRDCARAQAAIARLPEVAQVHPDVRRGGRP